MMRQTITLVAFFFLALSSIGQGQLSGQSSTILEICLAESEAKDGWRKMEVEGQPPLFVAPDSVITHDDILSAEIKKDSTGRKGMSLRLTKGGGEKLFATTKANLKKKMAIIYDGKVLMAPVINSAIGREVMISGDFSSAELDEMLASLHPGPRPPSLDEAKLKAFSKRMERAFDKQILSGTILVAIDGKIEFEKSVGYANIEAKTEFAEDSSFRLASVSKQFTAMGIMILNEDGKLDFDDDIRKYLPGLHYEGVTIRHLLHHNGGLPDYMDLFDKHWTETIDGEPKTAFNSDMLKLYSEHKPKRRFAPGEDHEYSNTGYVLLGSIIEAASGQTIHEFFRKRIFEPLEMKDSAAFSPDEKIFKPANRVYGFEWSGDKAVANDWNFLNGMVGDGGIYSSARDLLKWDQALYGEKLVSKATLDEAFTAGKLNDGDETGYGFGWLVDRSKQNGLVVSHGGAWVGFRTAIERQTDRKVTLILLSNNTTQQLDGIMQAVTELVE